MRAWRRQGDGVPEGATKLLEIRCSECKLFLMGVVYELGASRVIEMATHVVYRDTPGEWVLRAAAGGVEGVTVDHAPNVAWTLDPLDRPSRRWLYCGKCGAGPPVNTKAIRLALANRRRVLPL